jgi:hypothetical protein
VDAPQEKRPEAHAQAALRGGSNGRVVVRAVLRKDSHPCIILWNKALPLRWMEIKTLQDSTNQRVDWGVVNPSGGDSILDDQSWSRRLKYGLEIFSGHIIFLIGLKFRYWWEI